LMLLIVEISDIFGFVRTLHAKRLRNTVRKIHLEELWVVLHSDVGMGFHTTDWGDPPIALCVIFGIVHS
jgi:hypothetical protein